MAKIRTTEKLLSQLDEDFAWRRKELTVLKNTIAIAKEPFSKTALRAGITLLYAHWEGFIKNAAEMYLQFVATKGMKHQELSISFVALSLKSKLIEFESTNKSSIYTQLIEYVLTSMTNRANIPYKDVIKTGSNLSSSILKEILHTIGLDYSPYELKANLIDAQMLKRRNEVAHGEFLEIEKNDFFKTYQEITAIMENIKNQISNAVITNEYSRKYLDNSKEGTDILDDII